MEDTAYVKVIALIERLHRQFLEVVKLELERAAIHDLNNVQALVLYNIDDSEMSVGELTLRGVYLGSNVSYNVKKMVENSYLVAERSEHDLRSYRVKLTNKGRSVRDRLNAMYQQQVERLGPHGLSEADLHGAAATLQRLEQFWLDTSNRR